jgi:hypothetical protein
VVGRLNLDRNKVIDVLAKVDTWNINIMHDSKRMYLNKILIEF